MKRACNSSPDSFRDAHREMKIQQPTTLEAAASSMRQLKRKTIFE